MILHVIVRIVRIPICFPNGNILQSSSIVLNHNQGVNIDTAETETIFIAAGVLTLPVYGHTHFSSTLKPTSTSDNQYPSFHFCNFAIWSVLL